MSRLGPINYHAAMSMSANATPSLVMTSQDKCAITAHAAAGTYAITLDEPIDATECFINVTPRGAVPHIASVDHTSDTVKTVYIATDAGVLADVAFDFVVVPLR